MKYKIMVYLAFILLLCSFAFATDVNIDGDIIDCSSCTDIAFCQTYDGNQETVDGWTEKDGTLYNTTANFFLVKDAGGAGGRDGKIAYTQNVLNASNSWFMEYKVSIGEWDGAGESFFDFCDDGGTALDQDVYLGHYAAANTYIIEDTAGMGGLGNLNLTVRINLTSTTTANWWLYFDNGTLHNSGTINDADLNDDGCMNTFGQGGSREFYYHIVTNGNVLVTDACVPLPTSTMNTLYANTTHPTTYKTTFSAGEIFNVWCNYTRSDSVEINSTNGKVNISYSEIVLEEGAATSDFTMCQSGCDYAQLEETFTFHDNGSVIDGLRVEICHINDTVTDLQVTFECNGSVIKEVQNLSSVSIPACSLGSTANIFVLSTACSEFSNINITINNTAPNINSGHNFTRWELDRLMVNHLNDWNSSEVIYNESLGLFVADHSHEHYTSGTYTASCNGSFNGDNTLDADNLTSFSIVNAAPIVSIEQVNTSLGLTDLSNEVIIEFANGTWNWFITILDDFNDTSSVNYTIYNGSGSIIFTELHTAPLVINTSSSLFVDFESPYNLTVVAEDGNGLLGNATILFNVTDSTAPFCIGITNITLLNDTTYNFAINCTDEYIWSYNVQCNNSKNFTRSSIGLNFISITNSTGPLFDDLICYINVSDGHTNKYLEYLKEDNVNKDVKTNTMSFDGIDLTTKETLKDITYKFYGDRIKFCVETAAKENTLTFPIPANCEIAPNSKYKGHIICKKGNTWRYAIDLEGDYPITLNGNEFIVDVSGSKSDVHCFNSIVELNTLQETLLITVVPRGPKAWEARGSVEFTSTAQALFWIFIYCLWIFFMMVVVFKSGANGKPIQLFNLFQMFIGLVAGIGFMQFSYVIGFATLFIALGVFLGKIID